MRASPCPGPWSSCIQLALHSCKTFIQAFCNLAALLHHVVIVLSCDLNCHPAFPSNAAYVADVVAISRQTLDVMLFFHWTTSILSDQFSKDNFNKFHKFFSSVLGSFVDLMNLKSWWSLSTLDDSTMIPMRLIFQFSYKINHQFHQPNFVSIKCTSRTKVDLHALKFVSSYTKQFSLSIDYKPLQSQPLDPVFSNRGLWLAATLKGNALAPRSKTLHTHWFYVARQRLSHPINVALGHCNSARSCPSVRIFQP